MGTLKISFLKSYLLQSSGSYFGIIDAALKM